MFEVINILISLICSFHNVCMYYNITLYLINTYNYCQLKIRFKRQNGRRDLATMHVGVDSAEERNRVSQGFHFAVLFETGSYKVA